jgi:hypothetical protein
MTYKKQLVSPEITPNWDSSPYLVENGFEQLAERRISLKNAHDEIEKKIHELNDELGGMLATANMRSVRFRFHRLTLSHSMKGGKISKESLLLAGVSEEQLKAATSKREVGDPFVSVTEISEGSD